MEFARLLHVLGVVVWVGGMFFAYMALRPSAAMLDPPQRLPLWQATLRRFFTWVWVSIALILLSGFYMLSLFGGMSHAGLYIHIMLGVGVVMMVIFAHLFFAPFKRMTRAVHAKDWPVAGKALAQIGKVVLLNLSLGLLTIVVAILGRMVM
ncbi:MAG: CopD family protein [Betaproteobacteria bacterium]